jgi:hypothetical protein
VHKLAQRLTPELRAQIADDYRAGLSSDDLTEKYSLGKGPVLKLLHEQGVVMRRSDITESEIGQAIQLYADGWSCARIATQLNRRPSTVWSMLTRAGVKLRGPHEAQVCGVTPAAR